MNSSAGLPLKEARKYIFDYFREHSVAPVLEQVMRQFSLGRDDAARVLLELQDAHHIALVKGTQRILMAFPFSAVTTPFRVTAGRRTYFANCAWDAVAIHVSLGEDMRVESYCHHCAQEVQIRLKDQRVVSATPESPLVYLALPAARWWDDITNTCSNNMVFFSSAQHLDEWKESKSVQGGAALTVQKTIELSLPLYKTKMHLDYERPGKEELAAWFKSLGLDGEFWRL